MTKTKTRPWAGMLPARGGSGPAVVWTLLVALVLLGVPAGVVALQGDDRGFVEICKVGAGPTVGGVFRFTVGGITTDVPVGACSPAIQLPAGTVTVTEVERAGISVSGVGTLPESRLVSTDLGNRSARIQVVAGDESAQTTVTFTNKAEIALLKICKVAGDGVAVGTDVTYTAGTVTLSVPAGPPPGGTCGIAGWFPVATHVAVTESIPAGTEVSAITVAPPSRMVGQANLAGGSVVVRIDSGVTEATFTNRVPSVVTTTTVAPTAATTTTVAGVPTTLAATTTTVASVPSTRASTTTTAPAIAATTTTTAPASAATTTTTASPGGASTTTSPPGSGATTTTALLGGGATTTTVEATATTLGSNRASTTTVGPGGPVTTSATPGFTTTTVCVAATTSTVVPAGTSSTTAPGGGGVTTTTPGGGGTTTSVAGGSPTSTTAAPAPTSTLPPAICIPAPAPPRSAAALLVPAPGGPLTPGVASPLAKTGRATGRLLLLAFAALLFGALLVRPEPALAWAALRPRALRLDGDPPASGLDEDDDDHQNEFPALTFVPVVVAEPIDADPPMLVGGMVPDDPDDQPRRNGGYAPPFSLRPFPSASPARRARLGRGPGSAPPAARG